ncbi:hypothetical protein BAUCODRAFT_126802 [Baudoinia panamericana UAMH 10762]|uniref:Nephrocystin 3-like N-terminal domain-containing protein n=1 Tax=Baudoinia panamericana (strain UAMH 10762) TaxID=717646 RepID=M2MZR1_BAUPA|nr:uncharacterized protein BAUCODRAFT_126802 [Baudoinia panamericana UAMH 10762]EMC91825.1 hypothetical protein BAUCODRAFT_126802 [Baudoinia panamericana UAMH 10762]
MDGEDEGHAATQRLRRLINKAAHKSLGEAKNITEDHKLPHLIQIVELLQKQQAQSKQVSRADFVQPLRRTIYHRLHGGIHQVASNGDTAFLARLSSFDFSTVRTELLSDYCEVRKWFFQSQQYQQWLKGKPWQLRCYGEPRCGKTTFAAAVARDIKKRYEEGEDVAIISLFLQRTNENGEHVYDVPRRSALEVVLRTVLRQLIEAQLSHSIASGVLQSLASSRTGTLDVSMDALRAYVVTETKTFSRVFLIVDGIDHCPGVVQQDLIAELARLLGETSGLLRLLSVQSQLERSEVETIRCDRPGCTMSNIVLYWHCQQCGDGVYHICQACYEDQYWCLDRQHNLREPYRHINVTLSSPSDELVSYVQVSLRKEIDNSTSIGRQLSNAQEIIDNVTNTVAAKAEGVFLLAKLYMEYLRRRQTLDDVINILDRLPVHEAQYFDSMMEGVSSNTNDEERHLALAALAIVATSCYETRALIFEELVDAVQLLGLLNGSSVERLSEHTLLKITNGFLILGSSNEVQPFHATAGIYLYENCTAAFTTVNLDMVKLCCHVIQDARKQLDDCADDAVALIEIVNKRPFLRYALQHWGHHVRKNCTPENLAAVAHLLRCYERSVGLQQLGACGGGGDGAYGSWPSGDVLHVCAWFDLVELLSGPCGLGDSCSINARDALTGQTPLMVAIEHGNKAFVSELISMGADTSTRCNRGITPLWLAVSLAGDERRDHLVEVILPKCSEATLNARNDGCHCETVLMLAIRDRKTSMIDMLLARPDLDLAVKDRFGHTALHAALAIANTEAIERLLDRQDSSGILNVVDASFGRNPCMVLMESRYWPPQATSNNSSTEQTDRATMLGQLHAQGAHLNMTDDLGRSLLHYAALLPTEELEPIMNFLRKCRLQINAQDEMRKTPLHHAVAVPGTGCDVVELLLQHDADPTLEDVAGLTPLDVAVLNNQLNEQTPIVELLARHSGLSNAPDLRDMQSWQALVAELEGSNASQTNRALPLHLHDIQRHPLRYSLLHCAVESCSLEAVKSILEHSTDSQKSLNFEGETALSMAIAYLGQAGQSMTEIVTTLVDAADESIVALPDHHGHLPIDVAMQNMQWDVAVRLLGKGSELRLTQKGNQMLLIEALRLNEPRAVEKLLEAGASMLQRDREGKLPMQIAEDEQCSGELLNILSAHQQRILKLVSGSMRACSQDKSLR